MTTIRNRVVTADGDPIEGVRVVVYPVLASDPTRLHHPAVDPTVEEEILLGGETVTNATGDWTMDVTPTTALEPTDAVGYRVIHYPPGGRDVGAFDRVVIVPDSASVLWVPGLEELDPDAVTVISALDQHAADTTHVHGIADAGQVVQHDGTLLVGGLGKVKTLGPPVLEHLDPAAIGALTIEGPWDPAVAYAERAVVTHNATVWAANADTVAGEEPGVSVKWTEIPTGVDSELRSWLPFFVTDYGAVGDGVTDDTAAIQAAIDAAEAVAGGGVVIFPAGHTFLAEGLMYTNKITFQGQLVTDGTAPTLKLKAGATNPLFMVDPNYTDWNHKVQWRDMYLDGNKANQTGTPTIIEINKPGFHTELNNVQFAQGAGYGLHVKQAAVNLYLYNCTGGGCADAWLRYDIPATTNLTNLGIFGAQVDDCGANVIEIVSDSDGPANNVMIYGLETEGSTASFHDTIVHYTPSAGANAVRFILDGISAWRSGGGANAVFYEAAGAGPSAHVLARNIVGDGYGQAVKSDDAPYDSGGNSISLFVRSGQASWLNGTTINSTGQLIFPPNITAIPFVGDSNTRAWVASRVSGDAADRFAAAAGGRLEWGAGGGARDTFMQRIAAATLKIDDHLVVDGELDVNGPLDHNGAAVGFYGTAPIAKQTGVAVSASAIHAALVNLGLISG